MQPIPLSPLDGAGQCIADSALDTADIIVSAGQGIVAGTIRLATTSDISHASLYDGDGEVIEAVGEWFGGRQAALPSPPNAPRRQYATPAQVIRVDFNSRRRLS